jgi:hypothetical protein
MTDRVQSLTVFLEGDFRDDDVQILVDAISLMRGVARVDLGEPLTANDYMARQRVGYELRSKVVEAIDTFMANKRA